MAAELVEFSTAPETAEIPIAVGTGSGSLVIYNLGSIGASVLRILVPQTLVVLEGLRKPISVRIERDDDGVSVVDIDTGIFGAGDTLQEAVQDLHVALQDHLVVLAEQSALSPDLQHQLETLQDYFVNP